MEGGPRGGNWGADRVGEFLELSSLVPLLFTERRLEPLESDECSGRITVVIDRTTVDVAGRAEAGTSGCRVYWVPVKVSVKYTKSSSLHTEIIMLACKGAVFDREPRVAPFDPDA